MIRIMKKKSVDVTTITFKNWQHNLTKDKFVFFNIRLTYDYFNLNKIWKNIQDNKVWMGKSLNSMFQWKKIFR